MTRIHGISLGLLSVLVLRHGFRGLLESHEMLLNWIPILRS